MGNYRSSIQGPPYWNACQTNVTALYDRITKSPSILKFAMEVPATTNTIVLRAVHCIYIMVIACDIIVSSVYSSPFPLFSSNIDADSTLGFMGDRIWICIYVLTFVSFIGITLCLMHCLCMICYDPCKQCCETCDCSKAIKKLEETILCFGHFVLLDVLKILVNQSCTLQYALQLTEFIKELNPEEDETKTVFMQSMVLLLYPKYDSYEPPSPSSETQSLLHQSLTVEDEHVLHLDYCSNMFKKWCHLRYNDDKVKYEIDKSDKDNNWCKLFSTIRWRGILNETSYMLWILFFIVVVTAFWLCFVHSVNHSIRLLWIYYIVSYSVCFLLFVAILLCHFMDGLCRFKTHFCWMDRIKLDPSEFYVFGQQINLIWRTIEICDMLYEMLEQQSWLIRMIMEYAIFGDMVNNAWFQSMIDELSVRIRQQKLDSQRNTGCTVL
eukprot:159346_1